MKILIVTGGSEREREISLWSAKSVREALKESCHEVEEFDLVDGENKLEEKVKDFDIVFPIIHGEEGEGGRLQEKLEGWGVKYLGPKSHSCLKGWNKFDFKKFCEENGIKTPRWQEIESFDEIKIEPPFIIKPANEGSSFDFYIIKENKELKKIDEKKLFKKYKSVLVEEFIEGIEVTSGIWNDKILPLVEIRPPQGEVFDYKNKYNGRTAEIPHAPSLSTKRQEKVKNVSEKIRKGLDIRHFSRVDYLVRGDDIFALELNTIPAFTPESLLPKAIKADGMSMAQALENIIFK